MMNIIQFSGIGFSANCYALELDEDIALVDVGVVTPQIKEYISENRDKIKYVLLTHNHFDHICGVEEIIKSTSAKLVIHELDGNNLTNPMYNLTERVGLPNPNILADIMLKDGDTLPLGTGQLKIIHTPGHTAGSACYLIEDVMFSGDTLFRGTVGRTDFIDGDYNVLLESLKKLSDLEGDYKVYPGHEDVTILSDEVKYNPYFRM